MLSHDIKVVRERFAEFRESGLEMCGGQVQRLVNTLREYENRARQMELAPPPTPVTITEQHLLDGSVVILPIIARSNKPSEVKRSFGGIDGGRDGDTNNGDGNNGGDAA